MECSCLTYPPLPGAAISIAISSNRDIVAQTKDSIQIFHMSVLESSEAHDNIHVSHVYPLDENHIVCVLQSTRKLTLLKLETLQELHPHNDIPLKSFCMDQSVIPGALFGCGLTAELGVSRVPHSPDGQRHLERMRDCVGGHQNANGSS